ncbi:MAG: hypothetical protein EP343_02140 [Deltaproteobacteria bacterium]|nr:MAG: hypothetical protein EP343_02140 [Deltaproteobacteria bacterium]
MRTLLLVLGLLVASIGLSPNADAAQAGTYVLDKATLGKKLKAKFAKLPANRKAFVAVAKGMFASLSMTLSLGKDGKATTESSMKVFGRTRLYKGAGTWTQKGGTVTIKTTVTSKKRKPFPQTIVCKDSGKGLLCSNPKLKQSALPFLPAGSVRKEVKAPAKRAQAPAKAPARPAAPARRAPAKAPARRAAPATR